ncbi:MAG: DsbA family protein [Alphaproteobacteria bacterium]
MILAVAVAAGLYWKFTAAPDLTFSRAGVPDGFRRLVSIGGEQSAPGLTSFGPMQEAGTNGATESDTLTDDDNADLCRLLFDDPHAPVTGPQAPAVTIIEFSDYQCPYCRILTGIMKDIEARQYDIRHIYKEWPILTPVSEQAARAAIAADRQGQYLPFRRHLMRTRFQPTPAYLNDVATALGLDIARFETDMADPGLARAFADTNRAARQLGLVGTPGLLVGQTIVHGAVDAATLKALIETERNNPENASC